MNAHDPEAAGFFLQQALEKILKAYLLAHGWELKRIHDLEALLNAALRYDPHLEIFRTACQKISAFYSVDRYPFITESGVTDEDVKGSYNGVKELFERLRSNIRNK